jgi:signal transduction histidine kinase
VNGKLLWAGILLVVAGCLALIALDVYELTGLLPRIGEGRQLVVHTFDVISTAQSLAEALDDAERSQRGYIITGNADYLSTYRAASQAAPMLFTRLKQLTAANPDQQQRMPMLGAEMDRRLAILQQNLRIREQAGFEAAERAVAAGGGSETMRVAIGMIGDAVTSETALLQRRLAGEAQAENQIAVVDGIGIALTMIVMAAGAVLIVISFRERERRLQELNETRTLLAQAQKMESLGQLAGGIAHDFNNMLAVIAGGARMLRRRVAGPDQELQRILDGIDQGTERAAALSGRLLAFSRRRVPARQIIDVNAVVSGMVDILRYTIGRNVVVETVLPPDLWPVSADPNQLENAVLNLAVNARDAMPEGGQITIETANIPADNHVSGAQVRISVRDTGQGMTPETLRRALEPFFTTKAEGRGTGLGLAQVHGFVKQCGGVLHIDSAPGRGTVVIIHLPAAASSSP